MAGEGQEVLDEATRELDLDDIEKILEPEADDTAAPATDAEGEDDLALELDGDEVAAGPDADGADLEAAPATTDGGNDTLDLSDLEKMLDVEDTTDSPALAADDDLADDLDLDFELQPAVDEEDDLELEFDMLEDEAEDSSALFDTSESEDLGLDLDGGDADGPEKADAEDDAAEGTSEGRDDDAGAASTAAAAAAVEAAAVGAAGAAASRDLTQELMDEMAAADTQTMSAPPAEPKPAKPAPVPPKKKANKLLIILLLLILLAAAAYFVIQATGPGASKFKLADLPRIPFISDWLGGKSTPEAIVPIETTLEGRWVQNINNGRLYVIQGRVKNEYSQPRSYIRVTGQIFADGRQFKRAAQAYCGNMPSREDLEKLPVADLQKRLSNRSGAENSNINVAPGQEVPFTVIFAGLPDDVELQEYAVEISGSLPVTETKSE
jgi:hypothetical protein